MENDGLLFWSRKGEIACAAHAPAPRSEKWDSEGWQPMPDFGVRMARYQCQHCDGVPLKAFPKSQGDWPLVLNVDDRPASLYVRNRALRMHGFNVANADTGEQAIQIARRLKPQLVLLDVHLPDIDGRDVSFQLKTDSTTSEIPVVLISSTLRTRREEEAHVLERSRADAYLAEPVEPEELASALKRLLRAS
jgi:twitching motility two-component system response regulator PilH